MRLVLLSLALLLSSAIPVIADDWVPEGELRVKRGNNSVAARSQFLEDFSQAPNPQTKAGENPGFVLDVTQYNTPRVPQNAGQMPVIPITPRFGQQAGTVFRKLLGRDLQVLGSRDVVLLIDKSGSMGDRDCPPPLDGLRFPMRNGEPTAGVSRWEWTEQEMISLSRDAAQALSNGMRVVLFDSNHTVYERVHVNQVSQIFRHTYPQGSTNVAAALTSQLERYFSDRARGHRVRPLVIAIVTDGLPSSSTALKQAILDLTRAVRDPSEVAITFLQIGNSRKGMKLVHELDDKLTQQGALHDLVDSKDFNELQQVGLAHALVDAINKAGQQH
jgi:uncharacterized protein YegL